MNPNVRYTFERGTHPDDVQIDARHLPCDEAALAHAQTIGASTVWDVGYEGDEHDSFRRMPRKVVVTPETNQLVLEAWRAAANIDDEAVRETIFTPSSVNAAMLTRILKDPP